MSLFPAGRSGPDADPSLRIMVVASIALHILVAVGVRAMSLRQSPVVDPDKAYKVQLVSQDELQGPETQTQASEPPPVEEESEPSPPAPSEESPPPATPKPEPQPTAAPTRAAPDPTKVPTRRKPLTDESTRQYTSDSSEAEETPKESQTRFPIQVQRGARSGVAASGAVKLDVEEFPYAYYLQAIQRKIAAAWVPPAAGLVPGATLECVIYFRIQSNGKITNVSIDESASNSAMDQSAFRAVLNAGPLPPLPYAFPGDQIGVHFSFALSR